MNVRERIYVKKVHLWLTVEQWEKSKSDAEALNLKQIELIRRNINKEYPYATFLLNLMMLVRKQGNLLNQIAKQCNITKSIGQEQLDLLKKIDESNRRLVEEVGKL